MSTESEDQGRKPGAGPSVASFPLPSSGRTQPASAPQVIVAIFTVLAACYFAKIVFVVLLVSILLAFILTPLVDLLERFHVNRSLAALIVLLLLLAAIYGLSYYSYSKATDFIQDLPKYSSRIRHTVARFQKTAEDLQKSTQTMLPAAPEHPNTVTVQQSTNWGDWLTGVGSVTEVILGLGFIPFLVYFMLSWQEHVRASTVMLFRMENRNTAYVTLGAISRMIRSFIVGNVVVGLFMGVVATIVFWILGVPYFYFIGFISGFLSLLPYLGVILALVPPLVAVFGQIDTTKLIAIIASVLALHIFALNVLYPKLVGSRVQLNPLAVTVALLVWGWLWGAMGLILAVPMTAAMKIIFDHVESLRGYGAWLGE
jgi:predicted PurR-regulated permease PerM